jgi:hypothetical protein
MYGPTGALLLWPNLGDFVRLLSACLGRGDAKSKLGGRCKARPEVIQFRRFYRPFNALEYDAESDFLTKIFCWGSLMFNAATTALLRAVLDEVCENVSRHQTGTRTHVASKILEAATNGTPPDRLTEVGREALSDAPTMWR